MTAASFPLIEVRFHNNKGALAAHYLLDQFQSGTGTDLDTFTDYAGLTPNEHPIVLDEFGRCSMFGAPGGSYTFRLRDPVTGAVEWTRDNIAVPAIAASGNFVPLDGSTAMTGLLTLSGPATESLNPVTLEQLNDSLTTQLADLTTLVDAATAAAAVATAAAAAVTPTSFELVNASGGSATRDVALSAGTWKCVLRTMFSYNENVNPNYNVTVTQAASVSTTSLATSARISRSGGSGYGRDIYGGDLKEGTLTLAAAATVTMSMSAAVLGITTSRGSILTVSKL